MIKQMGMVHTYMIMDKDMKVIGLMIYKKDKELRS